MKISRFDLDGVGSPSALVSRILEIERDLPLPVPIEALCERFDIISISDLHTEGFEAALVTDEDKAAGAILVASGRSRQRRRFSIAHELGHFLIPTHMPRPDGQFLCSAADMLRARGRDEDRRLRVEAEANRFASQLLIPPPALRTELHRSSAPDLGDIVRLAHRFDVSKEAMARAYAQWHPQAVAIIVQRHGRVLRSYRNPARFPGIAPTARAPVPPGTISHHSSHAVGTITDALDCEPELWVFDREARRVQRLTEQMMVQKDGFALVMLHAEMRDEEDDGLDEERSWTPRF